MTMKMTMMYEHVYLKVDKDFQPHGGSPFSVNHVLFLLMEINI